MVVVPRKKNKVSTFVLTILCAFLTHSLFVKSAAAQTATGYTIDPAYQEVVIEADEPEKAVVTTTVTLTNSTPEAATFEVFAIEFPDTQHFGSFQNTDFTTIARQEVLAVRFNADRFVVSAGGTHTVTLRIENRTDLRPGGTYVSIILRQVVQPAAGVQPVVPALASQLLIRKKGGEVRNMSLTKVTGIGRLVQTDTPATLSLIFMNEGNVHLVPRGSVVITDLLNRVVAQGIVNDGSLYVLPGRQRVIPVTLARTQAVIPLVPLTLTISGSAESTNYTYEQSLIVIPLWLIGLVCVFAIVLVARVIFRSYSKKKIAKELPHVPQL